MVNFNWEFLLSILQFCASSFRIARSDLGIRLLFACGIARVLRDAGDEGAFCAKWVQAGGAVLAISWLVVVENRESLPDADVMPGGRVNCSYAFAPNPYERVFTLVRFSGTSMMDVIISILYFSRLSRRRSRRCSDTKDEDNSELDKEFAEHCNVGREKTCGYLQN